MIKNVIVIVVAVLVVACAGPNPNPGERTTDMGWVSGNFKTAFDIAKSHAENGEPWAQLRLGIFYYNGWGVDKDHKKAFEWYKKAAAQRSTGNWANGKMVGAVGKSGYFNQNSDAIIAAFNLAQMYSAEDSIEKDLDKSLELINSVITDSNGESVFFCCEFSQSRYFTQKQFLELKSKIENEQSK